MAHVDNDMLMYSKRAVNRQYEVQGFRTGLWSGTELQALSSYRPAAGEWGRRVREEGLKAALEWRDGPLRGFRGAYESAPHERPVAGSDRRRGRPPRRLPRRRATVGRLRRGSARLETGNPIARREC